MSAYDSNNIFARLLRGDIPAKFIAQNDHAAAFNDIAPKAPTHILVIPKGAYVDATDFHSRATEAEIAGFYRLVADMAKQAGVTESGYRLIANAGINGGQEVPHYHVHILGGKKLGAMING